MNGIVDLSLRALLDVEIANGPEESSSTVTAWIDTAFDGHFVFPQNLIDELELSRLSRTEAILADGRKIEIQTYVCIVHWFDERIPAEVVANEGRFPLLGTALLNGRILEIDYDSKRVQLN